MKKTKATKKSGTIAYQLNPRYDLQGEATMKNPPYGRERDSLQSHRHQVP